MSNRASRELLMVLVTAAVAFVSFCRPLNAQEKYDRFIAKTPARSPAEQAAMFHLPDGFRIDLVASEPDVVNPIKLCFDAGGRLYCSQSIEYPFPGPAEQHGRDTIKAVVDTNGDRVPDTAHTFADGLHIPISITPIEDGLLGHSVPYLYRFFDADGDARADGRKIAYERFSFQDTHGMCSSLSWWIDGWVYGSHGFANTSTIQGSDKHAITVHSGNTFRLRPDGSHIESYTYGQVNPFGISFDPLGNVYTADCHSRPVTMLVRGAYYPSFGKPHDGLGFGPEMMRHSHGSTAIAGVVYYAADQFPETYHDTLFIGNPVTGCINHDGIERHGSTYLAIEQPDFLSCDDPWFRPVDLKLGLDGALYVADFYNPIIGHYEVPLDHPGRDQKHGRIWRISFAGEKGQQPPGARPADLAHATLPELVEMLGHANLIVRTHATQELVHRMGVPAVPAVRQVITARSTGVQRAHAIWVLARLGALDDELVEQSAGDGERIVRVHLVKALAEFESWTESQRRLMLAKLDDDDPFVRRAAADALGRHPHAGNIQPLLDLWQRTPPDDAMLVHTARIALRDTVQRLENYVELLRRYDDSRESLARLADICLGIRTADSAEFVLDVYERQKLPERKLPEILEHVGQHVSQSALPRLFELAETLHDRDDEAQRTAVLAVHRAVRGRGVPFPQSLLAWAERIAGRFLSSSDEGRLVRGIEFAQELRLKTTSETLVDLARTGSVAERCRGEAMRALMAIDPSRAEPIAAGLASHAHTPANLRREATEALGQFGTSQSRRILLDLLKVAPESFALTISRSIAQTPAGSETLLAAVEKGHASPRLLQDRTVNERLRASKLPEIETRLKKQLAGLPPADERLRSRIAAHRVEYQKAAPSPERGVELFIQHCAACHKLNGEGNKVGPELEGVGRRGLERLLEDLLDPHRNVDANFRATVVALDDGRIVQGLVQREQGGSLLLVDGLGKEQQIPLAEIVEQKKSKLSPMPADVSEKLSPQELYDLLGYLLDQQQEPEPSGHPAG